MSWVSSSPGYFIEAIDGEREEGKCNFREPSRVTHQCDAFLRNPSSNRADIQNEKERHLDQPPFSYLERPPRSLSLGFRQTSGQKWKTYKERLLIMHLLYIQHVSNFFLLPDSAMSATGTRIVLLLELARSLSTQSQEAMQCWRRLT